MNRRVRGFSVLELLLALTLGLVLSLGFSQIAISARTTDASQHAFAHGFLGQGFDALDQRVARNDVDAGVFVGKRGLSHGVGPNGACEWGGGPINGLAD